MIALPYACVFFDFDGVVVDSVDAKIKAFGELYAPFGDDVRRAVEEYQRAVPGETRFEKIPRFHRELLGEELSAEETQIWCNRLSDIVLEQIVACPLLPDVIDVLSLLARRGIAAHVVSGTPQDELCIIAERKGLAPFFESLRGAPERKAPIVRDILSSSGFKAADCLFIGDAMTDYNAARETGTAFLGCAPDGTGPFPEGTIVVKRLQAAFFPKNTMRAPTDRKSNPEGSGLKAVNA
ncbi:MAG: HAD family hydrolase [Pseudomonadota bacterium]